MGGGLEQIEELLLPKILMTPKMFDTIEEILLPKILNDPKNVSRHCIVGVFTTSKCQVGLRLSSSVCVLICLVLAIFVFLY